MTDNEVVPGQALTDTVAGLYRELLQGPPSDGPTWITSGGPETALYGCVADLSAEQASRELNGSTIAAHVEHMRWALQLVNDWFDGQAPGADWSESWSVSAVDPAAWENSGPTCVRPVTGSLRTWSPGSVGTSRWPCRAPCRHTVMLRITLGRFCRCGNRCCKRKGRG